MTGRPSVYTPELAAEICERLACGESLRAICRGETMPGPTRVYCWLDEKPEFRERYARAREAQGEHCADEIIAVADGVRTSDSLVAGSGRAACSRRAYMDCGKAGAG